MRVYELAKEYDIKSTEFVDMIQKFGLTEINSHMKGLDEDQIELIRGKMSLTDDIEDRVIETNEWVSTPYGRVPDPETIVNEDEFKVIQEDEKKTDIGDSYTEETLNEETKTPKKVGLWSRILNFLFE